MFVQGDARFLPFRDGVASTIVTSPPYWGLRVYDGAGDPDDALGMEPTVDGYVRRMVAVGQELARVLADDGTLWLVLGDSFHTAGGDRNRPAQKQRPETRGDTFRRANATRAKDMALVPQRVAIALQESGWFVRSEIIWLKSNALPEPVKDRPVRAHETIWLLTKRPRYRFNHEALREPAQERAPNRDAVRQRVKPWVQAADGKRNGRSVWNIPMKAVQGHSAVFPEELARRAVLAGSDEGDVVLDPFCGSGTVPRVAERLGRRGVGLDVSRRYLEMARGDCGGRRLL